MSTGKLTRWKWRRLIMNTTNNNLLESTFINAAPKQVSLNNDTYYFCGSKKHQRRICPAFTPRNLPNVRQKGPLYKSMQDKQISVTERFAVCNDEPPEIGSNTLANLLSCIIAATSDLSKATVGTIIYKSIPAKALTNTGRSASFFNSRLVENSKLNKITCK